MVAKQDLVESYQIICFFPVLGRTQGCYITATSKISCLISFQLILISTTYLVDSGGGQGGPKNSRTLKEVGLRTWWKMFVVASEMLPGLDPWVLGGAEAEQANRQTGLDETEVTSSLKSCVRKPFQNMENTRALLQVDETPASVLFIIWCVSLRGCCGH